MRLVSRSFASLALLGLLAFQPVLGQSALPEIEKAYAKTYKAASSKFLYGMYAHRSADFKAYDADGIKVEHAKELATIRDLLNRSLRFSETGKIVSSRFLDSVTVECDVEDTIKAVLPDETSPTSQSVLTIATLSRDVWALTDKGWQLKSSRLLEQTVSSSPVKA